MRTVLLITIILLGGLVMSALAQNKNTVSLKLDYAGTEALINALERNSISAAEIDGLLRVRGVQAMVNNVTRFIPHIGVAEFQKELTTFVRTKKGGEYESFFRFNGIWKERSNIRKLVSTVQANECRIIKETLSQLKPFRPDTGALSVTVYFLAGGVSGGFAFENDPSSIYANLVRSEGDINGMLLNVQHETYHVMQIAAQKRAGINPLWVSDKKMPPAERIMMGTLVEGTANYVADPTRSTATGVNLDKARNLYQRSAAPERIAKNFALFDEVLKEIRGKQTTWEAVYKKGFTSENDDSFYFVGYEMAKALDRYCGRKCIGKLFKQPPVKFFRQYIALYKKHPEIKGRFSNETEAFIKG